MSYAPQPGLPRVRDPDAPRPSERRRAGRVRCSHTSCQFGTVSDFSRTGVRVLARKPVKVPEGKSVNLKITAAGLTVTVPARVASNRRRPDGQFEIGFEFVGLNEQWTAALVNLARVASSDAGKLHQLKFAC